MFIKKVKHFMKYSFAKSILKLKSICKAVTDLVKENPIVYPYRVISIDMDEHENCIARVQIVGKGHIFKAKPEEILSDDDMTCSFSQKDIRMLTYLGYLSVNSPKYKILAQRLSEQDNKILFAILKRGEKKPTIKTADQISSDNNIIQNLTQRDAQMIGYTLATEQILSEQKSKQECRQSLNIAKEST